MRLLIDGYNLLNATTILGQGRNAGTLETARIALLDFLAQRLSEAERQATTIVFDAKDAPPGLPSVSDYQGITVRFSPRRHEADELLEELIRDEHVPRRLTVVSSDHRVQRAARRRQATAIDSDLWFRQTVRRPPAESAANSGESKPADSLSEAEVKEWLGFFGELR